MALVNVSVALAQSWGAPAWSDEFNGKVAGAAPDAKNWTYDVGSEGWGNKELEMYCATGAAAAAPCDGEKPNAFLDGKGHLIIQAVRTSAEPAPTGTWTSARLKSLGLQSFQYGRIESCMQLPVGAGLWPAFWMMGTEGKWPVGGEIDIMENVPATGGAGGGLGPKKVESTIHGPSTGPKGIYSLGADFTFTGEAEIDEDCHVYGFVWSPNMVQFYVDDWQKPFFIRTASDVPAGDHWVFNAPFYFLLNLAVGGTWPGPPDATTPSPAKMVVDYVRVYKAEKQEGPRLSGTPIVLNPDGSGSGMVQVGAPAGTGFVYLGCKAPEGVTCAIDSWNSLNPTVVDLRAGNAASAKVNVTMLSAAREASVVVTGYTVGGREESVTVAVGRK
jgi:beta-glucanase (GH16 family)